jgi:hypothetical protein
MEADTGRHDIARQNTEVGRIQPGRTHREAGTARQDPARQNTNGDGLRKAGYSQAENTGRQAQTGRMQLGRTH